MATVMEKGVVTLDQFLVEHRSELSMVDYTQIISSAFNIAWERIGSDGSERIQHHAVRLRSGRGLRVWKGVDLEGSLPVNSALGNSSFMATAPFMAPELLAVLQLAGRGFKRTKPWTFGPWASSHTIFSPIPRSSASFGHRQRYQGRSPQRKAHPREGGRTDQCKLPRPWEQHSETSSSSHAESRSVRTT